jgi:hypothetical protein
MLLDWKSNSQLLISGQIAHQPIPASAAGLYLDSECIVANTSVTKW